MVFFLPYLLVALPIAATAVGGTWAFVAPFAAYYFLVLVERAIGVGAPRPAAEISAGRHATLAAWLWPPVQFLLLGWLLWQVSLGRYTPLEFVGVAIGTGLCTGAVGITVAHELIHRRGFGERLLGQALLASVTYHHFYVEHVFGHHRRAATPADPVTARRGQSVYAFWPRAIGLSFVSALGLEARRLRRAGRPAWSWRNRVLIGVAAEAALYAGVWLAAGDYGVLFLAVQSLTAILVLETINYVEHYGLLRREVAPGLYARYEARHAWDSHHRFSNAFFFNLPRHADHHLHPGRRFPELELVGAAPRLPMGYFQAFSLALLPPLWFRAMNKVMPPTESAAARQTSIGLRAE